MASGSMKPKNKTLRATTTSGRTTAQQLTELQSVYSALTEDEKRNSYLMVNNANHDLYINNNEGLGRFFIVVASGVNIYLSAFEIVNAKHYGGTNGAIADMSGNTPSWTISLYA